MGVQHWPRVQLEGSTIQSLRSKAFDLRDALGLAANSSPLPSSEQPLIEWILANLSHLPDAEFDGGSKRCMPGRVVSLDVRIMDSVVASRSSTRTSTSGTYPRRAHTTPLCSLLPAETRPRPSPGLPSWVRVYTYADTAQVYDHFLYEADMAEMDHFTHEGGVFVEAMSVYNACHDLYGHTRTDHTSHAIGRCATLRCRLLSSRSTVPASTAGPPLSCSGGFLFILVSTATAARDGDPAAIASLPLWRGPSLCRCQTSSHGIL